MIAWYVQIFFEAIGRFFIVPVQTEIVFPAMQHFGGYDLMLPWLCRVLGGGVAVTVTFVIGYGVALLRPRYFADSISDAFYRAAAPHGRRFGWLLLFGLTLPLGTLLPAVWGFWWNKNRLK